MFFFLGLIDCVNFLKVVSEAAGQGVAISGDKDRSPWDWGSSAIFAASIVTTIGMKDSEVDTLHVHVVIASTSSSSSSSGCCHFFGNRVDSGTPNRLALTTCLALPQAGDVSRVYPASHIRSWIGWDNIHVTRCLFTKSCISLGLIVIVCL